MTNESGLRPITMQDVRLAVGEGPLKPADVLAGCNAELARRKALISPAGGAGGWQPIETAPKMSHVMLWFPKGEHVIALINGPNHYETVGYFGTDAPTHWQSLPAAPGGMEG